MPVTVILSQSRYRLPRWRMGRQSNERDGMSNDRTNEIELADRELDEVSGGFIWLVPELVFGTGAFLAGYGAVRFVQDRAGK